MTRFLSALLVTLMLIAAYLLINLGIAWLDVGYGLNPWIAFPWAAFNLVVSAWIVYDMYKAHKRLQHALGVWGMRSLDL